jgi:argininosuccinate lyase
MSSAEFDAAPLEARAGDGWTTLTELADTLVRDHGLPFRKAHAIASHFVGGRQRHADRPLAALLADASTAVLGAPLEYGEAQLTTILSPRYFVEQRKTFGGPSPDETARAARVSRTLLEADQAWWTQATDALAQAEQTLAARAGAL